MIRMEKNVFFLIDHTRHFDELQAVSLNETLVVERLQTDHQFAKSNNFHWVFSFYKSSQGFIQIITKHDEGFSFALT